MIENTKQGIVLFDGVCNFCNGTVQFIIARDKGNKFLFASLQSDAAKSLLKKHQLEDMQKDLDTIIYIQEEQVYFRSDAILEIARHLNGIYKALYYLKVLPKFFRDGCYRLFSRHRYLLFGKKESCMLSSVEVRKKFIL